MFWLTERIARSVFLLFTDDRIAVGFVFKVIGEDGKIAARLDQACPVDERSILAVSGDVGESQIIADKDRALIVENIAIDEQASIMPRIDESCWRIGQITCEREGQIAIGGKLTCIGERGKRQGQIIGCEECGCSSRRDRCRGNRNVT
jgi:hypothetical protein